jgi:hypothetical protein
MTNLAASPVYAENPEIGILPSATYKKAKRINNIRELSAEDEQIIMELNRVKGDLENLHNRFDHTVEPLMLESIMYELKAANLKFMYLLNLCKDKGIVCRMTKD